MAEDKHIIAAHLAAAIIGRAVAPPDAARAAVQIYREVYIELEEDENRRAMENMAANRAGSCTEDAEASQQPLYPDA